MAGVRVRAAFHLRPGVGGVACFDWNLPMSHLFFSKIEKKTPRQGEHRHLVRHARHR
jgi:hypothetical protein